jgi:hypothetical protein
MTRAYIWSLIDWVNALRPSNEPYPLAIYDSVIENVDGRSTVRIYTNRFDTRDTLGGMLKLVEAQFGSMTASKSINSLTEYEWQIAPLRWVRLIYRRGAGTFIQLIDKGEHHDPTQKLSAHS